MNYSVPFKATTVFLSVFLLYVGAVAISLMTGPSGIDASLLVDMPFFPSSVPGGSIRGHQPLNVTIVTWLLLPRTLMALLCGAALGAAGVLIQGATRNPFASPATLGVNAGAMVAIVMGSVLLPDITGQYPVVVAFTGAIITTLLVFRLASAISHSPVNLVLVGMAITLSFGAISAGMLMFFENRLDGLYTWGAGNLSQFDFQAVQHSWPIILLFTLIALFFARQLDLIALGAEQAQTLGVNVRHTVGFSLLIAVILSSTVVSQVGMISFVGLIAPHIARGLGCQSVWSRLLLASVVGAWLLLSADIAARLIPIMVSDSHYSFPAGVMTTIVGAPFMIFLLTRRNRVGALGATTGETGIRALFSMNPNRTLAVLSLLCLILMGLSLSLIEMTFMHLRWPRVMSAAFAGAALGVSGLVLQTLTRNPLTSPDVSGLTTTAVLFIVLGAVLYPGIDSFGVMLLAISGSGFALILLLTLSRLTGFNPLLFALGGLCLSAVAATLISMVLVLGSNQSSEVLIWLSGSTYAVTDERTYPLFSAVIILLPILWMMWRRLDILQLGAYLPTLLGIRVSVTIALLLVIVALLSAFSVAAVGGVSFVGLMAPHICRVTGMSSHRHLIPAAAITGALLLVSSDWLSRTVIAPFEIPSGLLVSGAGGIYFILLLLSGKYMQRR
ncbi:iron ABC transporter permease [Endozoicomonas sp. GU-1]|uniref:iron ABC transporter permease n=1 Tax=Endozoicomonas sp. GU-1 TaxID=3009078 RepID=UPI0022B5D1CF|nr:iron ABC transporter permease [Endozoicomonas sp. GU-1]WBA81739.1 iron ABC transporter permease [Endozoicomonas sp. GU-1]